MRDAFRSELRAIITASGMEWSFLDALNTEAEADTAIGFVDLQFTGGQEVQFTFGAPGNNFHLETGEVMVDVYAPLSRDRDKAEGYASAIRNAFRGRYFSAGSRNVLILNSSLAFSGPLEGGMWLEQVALSYETYNVG